MAYFVLGQFVKVTDKSVDSRLTCALALPPAPVGDRIRTGVRGGREVG
jgi:hypothetical protein